MTATFFEYLGWVSLSPNLKESFNKTLHDAEQHHHAVVDVEHLLFALVDDPEGAIALTKMGVDRDELRDRLADHLDAIPAGSKTEVKDMQPTRELKKLMARASELADREHDDHIDGGDVIRALAKFEASENSFLVPLRQVEKPSEPPAKRHARSLGRKTAPAPSLPPNSGDEQMQTTAPVDETASPEFDMDPIKASIKAIMARRRDAEQILFECEWYHLFKSLNMIDEGLEGEEQTHRARLLARAEQELAERPRCRKAFLYVRHLDQELARLKGIVDIDWAGDISPDETVRQLAQLRNGTSAAMDKIDLGELSGKSTTSSAISNHLFDVKVRESEVRALEQKLLRLDRTADSSQARLRELEGHLETHDSHSRKRENVIGELESYLRSEMDLAKARDQRIIELEKELEATRSLTDSEVNRASSLENELEAFKEHAGNRERRIAELEARLKSEHSSAAAHEQQVGELQKMLETERERARAHDKQVAELQKTYEEEKRRAAAHEEQIKSLESDLKSRMEELAAREEHIKNLQKNLSLKEEEMSEREEQIRKLRESLLLKDNDVQAREDKLKKLEADLASLEERHDHYKNELAGLENNYNSKVQTLLSNIEDKEGESRQHKQEINALRAQLANLENRLKQQETNYTVEKVQLTKTIEQLSREIKESESLVEIVRASGEPYRLPPAASGASRAAIKIVSRRTIPVARPRKAEDQEQA